MRRLFLPVLAFAFLLPLPVASQETPKLLPAQVQPSGQPQQARHFELNPMENCKTSLQIEAHRTGKPFKEDEAEKECLRRVRGEEPDGRQKLYAVCRKLEIYAEFLICMGDKTVDLPAMPPPATPSSGKLPSGPAEQTRYKRLDPQLKKTNR